MALNTLLMDLPMPTRSTSPNRETASTSRAKDKHGHAASDHAGSQVSPEVRKILQGFKLEDVPTHLLRRAHFRAEEMFAQTFASDSITPRQKAALVILYQEPGLSQSALADRLFMDRNTMAEMVKRLSAAGLIQRVAAKDDQRAYQLFLAPEGARLLERVMPRDVEVERRFMALLPDEYRPLFLKCLRIIVEAQQDSEPPAS